jgi:hypothetical protein
LPFSIRSMNFLTGCHFPHAVYTFDVLCSEWMRLGVCCRNRCNRKFDGLVYCTQYVRYSSMTLDCGSLIIASLLPFSHHFDTSLRLVQVIIISICLFIAHEESVFELSQFLIKHSCFND